MKKNATKATRKTSSEAPSVEATGKGLQLTVALPELLHEELYGVVRSASPCSTIIRGWPATCSGTGTRIPSRCATA